MTTEALSSKEIYELFSLKVKEVNKKEILFGFLKKILLTLIFFLIAGFVFVLSEFFFRFNSLPRTIIFYGYLLSLVGWLLYFSVIFLTANFGINHNFNLINYAARIGREFPQIKDNLANSLSIFISPSSSYYSQELRDSNLKKVRERYSGINLFGFIPFGKIKIYLIRLSLLIFLTTVSFSVFPGALMSSLNRFINYSYEFIDDNGILLEIFPGSIKIKKGSSQKIFVSVKTLNDFKVNDSITVFFTSYSNSGEEIKTDSIKTIKTDNNFFFAEIESINTDLVYYAGYRNIRSEQYKITLEEYAVLKNFTITINPPAYTNSSQEKLKENEGNFLCPEGSKIDYQITSNIELSEAGILFNGTKTPFKVNGVSASGSFTAKESGSYYFYMKDLSGIENRSFDDYKIDVIKDKTPSAIIFEPAENDYTLKGEKTIPVRIRISDDYGFSDLKIVYRVIYESNLSSTAGKEFMGRVVSTGTLSIPIMNKNSTGLEIPYLWDIYTLKLSKGQIAEYYAEITDVAGKTGVSERKILRFKPLSESVKELQKLTAELEKDIKTLYNDIENLQTDLTELQKELQNSEELGVNDPEKRKQLEQSVENVRSNINAVQKKIDEAIQNLQQNNELSSETLDKFMQIQEMFNKLVSPEFLEKLRKIQEALKKSNPNQVRQELQNINFDEEAYKKQLEQIMNLLKQIENLQKLNELNLKAEEMYREQENLKLETMNSDNKSEQQMNELSDKQKQIQDMYEKFKQDLKNLTDDLKDKKSGINTDKLDKTAKKSETNNTDKKMQKSSEELRSKNKDASLKTQDQILSDLSELSEDMMEATESAMEMEGQFEKVMENMKNIKEKLQQLATEQGKLTEETKQVNPNNKGDIQNLKSNQASLQKQLSDLMNQLFQMSTMGIDIPQELGKELGDAYNSMNKAQDDLNSSNSSEAAKNQGKAQQSLNNAANMLDNMMKQMGKQGKQPGSGKMGMLMSKLAQLIKLQEGLNAKMNEMGKNGKTGNQGKEGQEADQSMKDQMDRIKLQQEQIKKSLEELNSEIEKEYKKSGEKPVGDLNPVIEDMKKNIRELEKYNIDPEALQRQNRILNRMLEFQLSQREKDFEQKRESKPGENILRISPSEIIISGPASYNAIKEDYLKKQGTEFSEEYLKIIEYYFRLTK